MGSSPMLATEEILKELETQLYDGAQATAPDIPAAQVEPTQNEDDAEQDIAPVTKPGSQFVGAESDLGDELDPNIEVWKDLETRRGAQPANATEVALGLARTTGVELRSAIGNLFSRKSKEYKSEEYKAATNSRKGEIRKLWAASEYAEAKQMRERSQSWQQVARRRNCWDSDFANSVTDRDS